MFQKVLWLGKSKQWTQRVLGWSKKNPQNNSCDVKFWSFDRIDTQDIQDIQDYLYKNIENIEICKSKDRRTSSTTVPDWIYL